jgi:hypothetical protein
MRLASSRLPAGLTITAASALALGAFSCAAAFARGASSSPSVGAFNK